MNRWIAGNVMWPMTERLLRRDTMRRFRALQRSDGASGGTLREMQDAKLRRLLAIAAGHTPYHARRFRAAGFDPRDPGAGVDDLVRLPTLTREEIREHLAEMTWADAPRGGPLAYTTGGSTGEPLRFHIDRFRQAADWAARWRARGWWGVGPGDREVLLWGAPIELRAHDRLRRWRDRLLNQRMLNAFDMTDARMDGYLERIRVWRPACLYGYASSLALLARRAAVRGLGPTELRTEGLRAAFVTGETLFDADRHAIEAAFGAPVVIEYGCRDGGLLACGCPAGRLHVPQENVIVELVDGNGQPVGPGEVGEVAVTYLEQFAMPLIRCRVGDLARWADGSPCPCGRAAAALSEVRGRVTDQIVCRAGDRVRRMHALSLIYILREADGIEQFRITQRSLERVDVELVTGNTFSQAVEREVLRDLERRLGPEVDVRLIRRERINPGASGKHACVVSDVRLDSSLDAPPAATPTAHVGQDTPIPKR